MSCSVTGVPGCNVVVQTGGGSIEVKDEGVTVDTEVESIDFVGGMVTATEITNHNIEVHVQIPELTSDPVSPAVGDAWVLKTGGVSGGLGHSIVTLGLTLDTSGGGGGATYEFRYKTTSDGIVGVALT